MDTLAKRLIYARGLSGKSQADIAEAVKMKQPSYHQIESGKTKRTSFLGAIARELGVNYEWLESGNGEMISLPHGTSQVSAWDDDTPLDDDEFQIPFYKEVIVSAGSSEGSVHEQTNKKIRMSKSSARKVGAQISSCFSYKISGDSMADMIQDGARCTADASKKEIKDGKIYVFRHGVMRRTKYLFRQPDGGLLIRSHNADYADEVIKPEDMEQIEILGWVWEWSNMVSW